jgi:glycosyltransferase involved in cell wall biosynthesis
MSNKYLLVSGDFVKTGGMDRANYALASYLLDRGDEVHLVAFRVGSDLLERPNAVFHRVPKPLNSYTIALPVLSRQGRRWAGRVGARGGRVVVNGGNCDWGDVNWVHYVHAAWTPRPSGGLLRRVKGAVFHRAALTAERVSLHRARFVIANSEQTRAVLLDRLDLPPERVHTVYYGVDPEQFRPATGAERAAARARLGWDDDRPSLVFVGALGDLRKGLDTLLAAWRRLVADTGWDARLAVVGTGARLDRLRHEARDLGGSVAFLGFRRDVPEILRACDALVSPTRYEAYGLSVQEALCCGIPALVTRTAGIAERYPSALQDLLIPSPEDVSDLVGRLRNWRNQSARFAAAIVPFSQELRNATWDHMAQQMTQVVEGSS